MRNLEEPTDRRTLLGSSIHVLQPWTNENNQINHNHKVLVKLYDDKTNNNINFKLNEINTFIGILECPLPKEDEGDQIMTSQKDEHEGMDPFESGGVPNADS